MSKTLEQQRATFRSESSSGEFSFSQGFLEENEDCNKNTLLLVQFLSTTGPEESLKSTKKQLYGASRIFKKLRKRPSVEKLNRSKPIGTSHNPLRDSGVYSETSEKESFFVNDFCFPQPPRAPERPAPPVQTIPKKVIEERLNSPVFQAETKSETLQNKTCPHCHQNIKIRARRASSPAALSSGKIVEHDSRSLLAMIHQLKNQLAEEKRCRITLEKAVYKKERQLEAEEEERKQSIELCF